MDITQEQAGRLVQLAKEIYSALTDKGNDLTLYEIAWKHEIECLGLKNRATTGNGVRKAGELWVM